MFPIILSFSPGHLDVNKKFKLQVNLRETNWGNMTNLKFLSHILKTSQVKWNNFICWGINLHIFLSIVFVVLIPISEQQWIGNKENATDT